MRRLLPFTVLLATAELPRSSADCGGSAEGLARIAQGPSPQVPTPARGCASLAEAADLPRSPQRPRRWVAHSAPAPIRLTAQAGVSGRRRPRQGLQLLRDSRIQDLVLAAGGLLLLALVACLVARGSLLAKRYAHETVSAALAATIGIFTAQVVVALLSAVNQPEDVSLHVECVVLGTIFTSGFFALSYAGWTWRCSPERLLVVRTLGASLVGFFGVYTCNAVWKEIALHAQIHSQHDVLWVAGGTLCMAIIVLAAYATATQELRTRCCEIPPESEQLPGPSKTLPVRGHMRGCGIKLCHVFGSTGAQCIGKPSAEETHPAELYEEDVMAAENSGASLIVALFAYKALVVIISAGLPKRPINMLATIGTFAGVLWCLHICIRQCRATGRGRSQQVLAAVGAQLLGISLVGGLTYLVEQEQGSSLFLQAAIALALSLLTLLALSAVASDGCQSNPSYGPLTRVQLQYPQAPVGLGIMLAMSWSNVLSSVLELAVHSAPVVLGTTSFSLVVFTALTATCLFFAWKSFAVPLVEVTPSSFEGSDPRAMSAAAR